MADLADLRAAPGLLAQLMIADPRLLLVRAIAWLDPAALLHDLPDPRYIEFDYDAEDDLTVGLHVARECFPTVYAGAIQYQWQGADDRQIARYLVDGIGTALVYPITCLDELRYGPPVDFRGIDLSAYDTDQPIDPRLLTLYALFGLSAEQYEDSIAFFAAKVLIDSLVSRTESAYQDLAHLLMWMFGVSGNTAVDYTLEVFWENGYDTAGWTPDEVTFINEINLEAHELITSAECALDLLETDTQLRTAFSQNIQSVLKAVRSTQRKGKSTHGHINPDPAVNVRNARWPDCP